MELLYSCFIVYAIVILFIIDGCKDSIQHIERMIESIMIQLKKDDK